MFQPLTRDLGSGMHRLQEPVIVHLAGGPNGWKLEIPAGYVTDYASIPAALHWLINPDDEKVMLAALVHDFIYHTHVVSRAVADAIFYQLLRQSGLARRLAKLMFLSVHLTGKRGYLAGPDKLRKRSPRLGRYIAQTPAYEVN